MVFCSEYDNLNNVGNECYCTVPGNSAFKKNGRLMVESLKLLNKNNNCKYWVIRKPWYYHIFDLFQCWHGWLDDSEYPRNEKQ